MSNAELHPSIVALVSLAANIAANHPKQGLCQVERLREYGISEAQIDIVVDIARHIRAEAAQSLDATFDEAKLAETKHPAIVLQQLAPAGACCTPTDNGNSCC